MNNKNKFRVWDIHSKSYQNIDIGNSTQQFIGIWDKNLKEVYENDVVKFKTDTKEDIGIVRYMNDYCSYVVEVDDGYDLFADISFDSLEIVGNINENYGYNQEGVLFEKTNP